MQLSLTDHEAHLLRQVLESYLKDLRGEIVDTDNPSYRRELRAERDTLVEIVDRVAHQPHLDEPTITKVVRVTAVLTDFG